MSMVSLCLNGPTSDDDLTASSTVQRHRKKKKTLQLSVSVLFLVSCPMACSLSSRKIRHRKKNAFHSIIISIFICIRHFHFQIFIVNFHCDKNVFCSSIFFLVSRYANVAKWLSPRYRMWDVHGNAVAFVHWDDIPAGLRVRISTFSLHNWTIWVEPFRMKMRCHQPTH